MIPRISYETYESLTPMRLIDPIRGGVVYLF